MTTTRKQSPTQARKTALESDFAPLYAVAGLADSFAEQAKTTLVTTRTKVRAKSGELEAQAKSGVGEITKFVKTLPEQVKTLPTSTKVKLAEAQQQAKTIYAEAASGYGDLAGRGKRVVDEVVGTVRKLSTKAEQRAEQLAAEAAELVDPAFETVQEGVTVARQKVTGHTATETVVSRSTAKATATRAAGQAVAEEQAAARKASAKRAAATRAANKSAAEAPAKKAAETSAAAKPAASKAS